jgi:5'-nucleotidase
VSAVPEVDVALGGHEHENWIARRGPRFVPIVKADANVRSLAIVSMAFGAPGTRPVVSTRLQIVDDTIPDDPAVAAVVQKWVAIGNDAWRRDGFDPDRALAVTSEALDGRESTVRNRQGKLTDLIVSAIAREGQPAEVALFNGGSVRVDDVLPPGPITEYDIIRVLPFGGRIARASLQGALLARVLDTGQNNQGLGGYLHVWGARWADGAWQVAGKPVDPNAWYHVALPEFLLTGGEVNLGFLTRANPQVRDVQELRDIRRAVIDELQRNTAATK